MIALEHGVGTKGYVGRGLCTPPNPRHVSVARQRRDMWVRLPGINVSLAKGLTSNSMVYKERTETGCIDQRRARSHQGAVENAHRVYAAESVKVVCDA